METYLVGGAVRDRLLGLPVSDRDWVVTGASPEQLVERGFRPVGRDFPVFLHPESGEEYALARTERKSGHGYAGFTFRHTPDVTLEQDLERRDLTVNAIAESADGTLIDPFGGQRDLDARVLRHVSPAFAEDPLRILRVARFAARFSPLGFTVAPETLDLMAEMVRSGEADHLVPERVWQETRRALAEPACHVYISLLRECGALAVLLPEVDALFGVPQTKTWHPEVDTGVHVLMVLEQAAAITNSTTARFAALLHDLGKAVTPDEVLPGHRGHEEAGLPLVDAVCERMKVPRSYRDLALLVCEHHLNCHRAMELRPATLFSLLEKLDALRRPDRFEEFLLACEADARGRKDRENEPYPQADYLRKARDAAAAVDPSTIDGELRGAAFGEALREKRVQAVSGFCRAFRDTNGAGTTPEDGAA